MRRNFAQVLESAKVDLKNEYMKFYELFYGKDFRDNKSIAEIVSDNFIDCHFRGTCLTLEEFDKQHGFIFERQPQEFDEEYLVCFTEYIYNLIICVDSRFFYKNIDKAFFLNQIRCVIDLIGYTITTQNGFSIFIPKDNNAIAVAESELIPENLSYKVLEYNHHSVKGNIESKKDILVKLANILEPKRKQLEEINKKFTSDLFQLINSCNIRHNNKDELSRNYYKYVAEMNDAELEYIYDEIYQMCLLAFMQLEHIERKKWLEEIKNNIRSVK